jgi:hypothetical protein
MPSLCTTPLNDELATAIHAGNHAFAARLENRVLQRAELEVGFIQLSAQFLHRCW